MASQDILINWAPQETRVAIVENGAVQELHIERELERGLVGNVYLGKVARVLPGMQSAFIDIGLDRAAFLHVADLNPPPNGPGGGRDTAAQPIERQIFEGQSLTVQVIAAFAPQVTESSSSPPYASTDLVTVAPLQKCQSTPFLSSCPLVIVYEPGPTTIKSPDAAAVRAAIRAEPRSAAVAADFV